MDVIHFGSHSVVSVIKKSHDHADFIYFVDLMFLRVFSKLNDSVIPTESKAVVPSFSS